MVLPTLLFLITLPNLYEMKTIAQKVIEECFAENGRLKVKWLAEKLRCVNHVKVTCNANLHILRCELEKIFA